MKTFQLIHVSYELGARSCIVTEKDLGKESTVSREEYEAAMKLEVGGRILLHYGENPIKPGNLIRKEDNNE
jgi:hypothetical protein